MSQSLSPSRPRRRKPTFRTVHVRYVEQLTPGLISITFGGDELTGFATRGPAEHIKVFFPEPGEEKPVIPVWGPNGPELPPGTKGPTSRTYTPRRWNAETNELVVHIVTHSGGVGANWAKNAVVGDTVVIAGPGRPFQPDPEAKRFLLAGDESALPAISAIAESLDASMKADVYVEVQNESDQLDVQSDAVINLTWLHRSDESENSLGIVLERTLLDISSSDGYDAVWVGCEAGVMRNIRRHLLYELNMPREAIVTRGYWKAGAENHPDHDMGEDI